MIFFVRNNGTIITSLPSPVYQGGANANTIYLIAPFASNLSVTVAFQLPNGVWTEPALMTQQNALTGIVEEEGGQTYSGWTYDLPNEITKYYGTVTAQFFFYAAQSGVITASSSTSFTVGRGVPAQLPATPSQDIYQQILSALSGINADLTSGTFTARSFYPYNAKYAYGYGEIVYFPGEGDFGVFLKSLKQNNTYYPYVNGNLNPNWELITDFNVLNGIMEAQKEVFAAAETAKEAAASAVSAAESVGNAAQNASQSAQEAQQAAESVKGLQADVEGILAGSVAVPKAIADGTGENIAEHFAAIDSLIPSSTTPENPLTNEGFVNSSINNMAAFYITSDAEGAAFPTHAALIAATTFYNGGETRVPTQNDYAIVLADESQPRGVDGNYPTTRYSYQGGVYPDGQWDFQYVVNNTSLTQAQVNAINSGITAQKIASMDAATAAKYTKPSGGIPESDLSSGVQAKLNATSEGYRKNLYNLGLYDTVVSNGDGTATITRKTGYKKITLDDVNSTWNGTSGVSTMRWGYVNGPTLVENSYGANYPTKFGDPSWISTTACLSAGNNRPRIYAPVEDYPTPKDFIVANPDIVIQYELPEPYNETVIENQPIHTLNQAGEEWLRDEWEKGLNFIKSSQLGVYTNGTRLATPTAKISAGNYILSVEGLPSDMRVAVVVSAIANIGGYPQNDLFDSGWILKDSLPYMLTLPAGYVAIRIGKIDNSTITVADFQNAQIMLSHYGNIVREGTLPKYYQHSLRLNYESRNSILKLKIINQDSTPFTFQTLRQYLKDNGFYAISLASSPSSMCYEAEGVGYDDISSSYLFVDGVIATGTEANSSTTTISFRGIDVKRGLYTTVSTLTYQIEMIDDVIQI